MVTYHNNIRRQKLKKDNRNLFGIKNNNISSIRKRYPNPPPCESLLLKF